MTCHATHMVADNGWYPPLKFREARSRLPELPFRHIPRRGSIEKKENFLGVSTQPYTGTSIFLSHLPRNLHLQGRDAEKWMPKKADRDAWWKQTCTAVCTIARSSEVEQIKDSYGDVYSACWKRSSPASKLSVAFRTSRTPSSDSSNPSKWLACCRSHLQERVCHGSGTHADEPMHTRKKREMWIYIT